MKHPLPATAVLLAMFLAAQVIGLMVVSSYIDSSASEQASIAAGRPVAVYQNLPYGIERPAVEPDTSFIFLSVAILLGTVILLLIMRFRKISLWKAWFSLAVILTLAVSFSSFLPKAVAAVLSLLIAYFKVFRPSVLAHNMGELFIYGGLAAIFVPILNVRSAAILLILIAAYDIFAVFLSRHMIALAKFQAANNIFAGLFIPKRFSLKSAVSAIDAASAAITAADVGKGKPQQNQKYADTGSYAVIGGGDLGFPLLFAGTALAAFGFYKTLVIPFAAAAALAVLLAIGKKGRFYPAMPFIAAGCFIGYGILKFSVVL